MSSSEALKKDMERIQSEEPEYSEDPFAGKRVTGRVVLGMDTPGPKEMSIQQMEGKRRLVWDEAVDEEYMARVREKARDLARNILNRAQVEAEEIKRKARQEGYDEGFRRGKGASDAQLRELAHRTGVILESIQEQGKSVLQEQILDITTLIRVAVEKAVALEMEERRRESLTNLLTEALERIDSARGLTVRVSNADAELMETLLEEAARERPDLSSWRLKTDLPDEGGVILETEEGMADNSLPVRWQGVEEVLDLLFSPGSQVREGEDELSPPGDEPSGETP